MKHFHNIVAIVAIVLLLTSCVGPDPVRLASERANLKLAKRCADGWFQQLPFDAEDQRMVTNAFDDWDRALKADEALVAPILGGGQ